MTDRPEVWYEVHIETNAPATTEARKPRIIETLATSKMQAEVHVLKTVNAETGVEWRCTLSRRSRG